MCQGTKRESQEVIKEKDIDKEEIISGRIDSIYLDQITAAQKFLNENHNADLSCIQRLLQNMLPLRYYHAIVGLKEHQEPTVVYNIYGSQCLYAPNAVKVEQNREEKSNLSKSGK